MLQTTIFPYNPLRITPPMLYLLLITNPYPRSLKIHNRLFEFQLQNLNRFLISLYLYNLWWLDLWFLEQARNLTSNILVPLFFLKVLWEIKLLKIEVTFYKIISLILFFWIFQILIHELARLFRIFLAFCEFGLHLMLLINHYF